MLTIEESQMIVDLRAKMHANVQDGKPSHEGLTPEQYRKCLDAVRQNRSAAAAAGAAKATKAKKKAAVKEGEAAGPKISVLDNPKFEKFKKFNLD